jgi:hypothetical protein
MVRMRQHMRHQIGTVKSQRHAVTVPRRVNWDRQRAPAHGALHAQRASQRCHALRLVLRPMWTIRNRKAPVHRPLDEVERDVMVFAYVAHPRPRADLRPQCGV